MIDIDIVEQLVPNPMTMLVQLCSTLVLFLLMKHFLWPSIKRFLDARANKMQEDIAAGEAAKQSALEDRMQAKEELKAASKKSEDIVNAAVQQAKEEKSAILAQANAEAGAVRKKAEEQIEADRNRMYASMQKEIVDVAFAAVGKLIGEQNADQVDRNAIDAFVKEANANDQ